MSQEDVKSALLKTIESLQNNPNASKVIFRAETELVENVRCKASVRNFPPLFTDEPPELAGGDTGMNPVELILAALGTCQEVMYSAYASVMGIPLESVKCNLKGNLDLKGLFGLDPNVPAGYSRISYETILNSSAPSDQLRQLAQTVESHCPVLDTLQRPIEVVGKVTANGQPLSMDAAAE
ncbi:MAG: OsmC family protein [Hyphomicrobiaceae bacterium]